MARAYFPLFFDQYISLVTNLNDEETGRLFRAMLFYAREGIELGLGPKESVVWPLIQRDIENSKQAYLRRCAANAANGRKGGRKSETEAKDSDGFVSQAMERQSIETDKTEKAEEYKKTKNFSLKAEQAEQGNKAVEAERWKQKKGPVEAKEAGPVQIGDKRWREMDFEEKRKRAMAMIADDYIREQQEKQGIVPPPCLRG